MKRPLVASCAFAAVGLSLILAGPAHAASTSAPAPSAASTQASTLGIILDSYDPVTREAKVTVTGVHYGQRISLIQKGSIGDGQTSTIDNQLVSVQDESTTATRTFRDVFRGDSIQVKEGLNPTAGSITITNGPALPESTVTTTVEGGVVHGTYVHARSGWTHVYDADRREVAFTPRSTQLADGSFATSFAIPDTGRTSAFRAVSWTAYGDNSEVNFQINDGMTALAVPAPTVGSVDPAGTRALATVTGEPGATATVKDAAGKTVAVKILGSTGTAQVIVPASTTRAANTYTATQTAGGATSAPTPFTA